MNESSDVTTRSEMKIVCEDLPEGKTLWLLTANVHHIGRIMGCAVNNMMGIYRNKFE